MSKREQLKEKILELLPTIESALNAECSIEEVELSKVEVLQLKEEFKKFLIVSNDKETVEIFIPLKLLTASKSFREIQSLINEINND